MRSGSGVCLRAPTQRGRFMAIFLAVELAPRLRWWDRLPLPELLPPRAPRRRPRPRPPGVVDMDDELDSSA